MKKIYSLVIGLCLCFFSSIALAHNGQSIEVVEFNKSSLNSPTMTLHEVMTFWGASNKTTYSTTANNVVSEGPTQAVLIMGAANSPGNFGSYFTTDLFVVNPHASTESTGTITVNVFALVNGVDYIANTPAGGSFTLQPRQCGIFKNIGQMLNVSGGFTLLMGTTSSSKTFSAWSYTSTPGLNGGKYGVNILGLGHTFQNYLYDGWNVGAEASSSARTNIAVFNLNNTILNINVYVYSPAGGSAIAIIPLSVPPSGCIQKSLSTVISSLSNGIIWFVYSSGGSQYSGSYVSYMVVNDNITNDANFQFSTAW